MGVEQPTLVYLKSRRPLRRMWLLLLPLLLLWPLLPLLLLVGLLLHMLLLLVLHMLLLVLWLLLHILLLLLWRLLLLLWRLLLLGCMLLLLRRLLIRCVTTSLLRCVPIKEWASIGTMELDTPSTPTARHACLSCSPSSLILPLRPRKD